MNKQEDKPKLKFNLVNPRKDNNAKKKTKFNLSKLDTSNKKGTRPKHITFGPSPT